MNQSLTVIEHITKEYPNNMYKVTIFNNPLVLPRPKLGHKPNRDSEKPSDKAIEESLRRTRTTIFDYALSNNFSYFVTFTFNPKKVDRYSIEATFNTMKYWLNRQKKHSPNFAYVIVPEFHKDGASAFTILLALLLDLQTLRSLMTIRRKLRLISLSILLRICSIDSINAAIGPLRIFTSL